MKSNTGWGDNGNGTNSSAFAGLPGGYRDNDGNFYFIGYGGYWWSSSEDSANNAWYRHLSNGNGNVGRGNANKRNGFSVRCLRD